MARGKLGSVVVAIPEETECQTAGAGDKQLWGAETDDPHIYLGGAGARRGGGVSGIAGHNAAMALLAKDHAYP